jgi:oligopeptidase A
MPVVNAVLTYAEDRALREQVWRGFQRRAAEPPHDNAPVVLEMLRLRQEQAKLLGFADFADLVLADRMAKTGAEAEAFVHRLERAARPAFEAEILELEAWAAEQGAPTPLAPWDVAFWAERLRKDRYDLDSEALRPYFVYDRVLNGMFGLARELFGIEVRAIAEPSWHPDVRVFEVADHDGRVLGTFHADFFSRPGKRDGAWMNPMITGAPGEGGHAPHVGVICGDMMPPTPGRPSLLLHREVETIFHEFGHLLHHLLTEAELYRQAGTNVAWDFVELPSQIMENWCLERGVLDLIARHVDTDETLPDELLTRLRAARTYRAATFMMRQLGFCHLDLTLHRRFDPFGEAQVLDVAREALSAYAPVPLPPDSAMVCSFSHLFAEPIGYAAGYYSYQWAAVLDADAFSRFQRDGLLNREIGAAFRRAVLAVGDSVDPAEAFRAFMGRDPDPAAHLARAGLVA